MGTTAGYLRQTTDSPNPIARLAHKARHELALQLVSQKLRQGGSVLDFGCGPAGLFLKQLANIRPDARLLGHDVSLKAEETATHFKFVRDLQQLHDHQLDIITCFEVYEHMYKHEHEELWMAIKRLLTPGGYFIMSVPIISGPMLLLKEMNQALFYAKKPENRYTIKELVLAAFFGIPAKPPASPRETHKGFDFRAAEADISRHCNLSQKLYSPFTSLPWYFNSQVFFAAVPAT
jgi:2-polyprenyl-3-methyl-5-hydroxy-6-metoxy-1,4-benzoquinol methylase